MTPANLQQLQAVGVDLSGRESGATTTLMHSRNWNAPGGREALGHLIAAGADPMARDSMGRVAFGETGAAAAALRSHAIFSAQLGPAME